MSFHVRVGSSGVIRLDGVRIWLRESPYGKKNLTTSTYGTKLNF